MRKVGEIYIQESATTGGKDGVYQVIAVTSAGVVVERLGSFIREGK